MLVASVLNKIVLELLIHMSGQQAESWLSHLNPSWQTFAEKEPAENRLKEKSCCLFFPMWFQCWFGVSAFPHFKCHFLSQHPPRSNPFTWCAVLDWPYMTLLFLSHSLPTNLLNLLAMCWPLLLLCPRPALTPSTSVGVFQLFSTCRSSRTKHPGLPCLCSWLCFLHDSLPTLPQFLPALPWFGLLQPPATPSLCSLTLFPSALYPSCSHHSASQVQFSLSPFAFASCLTSGISPV